MSDTSWILQIDPPAIAPERTMLDLNSGPIACGTDSGGGAAIDWGQVAVTEYLSQQGQYGSTMASFVLPNRTITISLLLGGQGYEAEQETARSQLAQKVALLQREGGQLLRQRIGGPAMYADIVDAQLTVPDIYGETGGIEPDVQLVLICLPDFYGDEQPAGVMLASNQGLLRSLLVEEVINYVANPSFAYDHGYTVARWSDAASDFLVAGANLFATSRVSSAGAQPELEISTTGTVNEGAEISLGVMPAGSYVLTFNIYTSGLSSYSVPVVDVLIGPHGDPNTTTISGLNDLPVAQTIDFIASGTDEIFLAFCSQSTKANGYVFINQVMAGPSGTYVDGDTPGYSWASAAGASQTVIPATVDGDYPARCRMVVNETANEDRHGMLFGLRSRHYDPAATAALVYEAEDLSPINGAAVATDDGTDGVSITLPAANTWTPFLLTSLANATPLTHQGTYRVLARVNASTAPIYVRLAWSVGTLAVPILNDQATIPAGFWLADLGIVRLDPQPVGTNAWYGVLQAYGPENATVWVDQLTLVPLDEASGEMVSVPTTSSAPVQLNETQFAGSVASELTGFESEAIPWNILASPAQSYPPASGVASQTMYANTVASDRTSQGQTIPWDVTASNSNSNTICGTSDAVGGAPPGGGPTYAMLFTNFGFAIPAGAVVTGIAVNWTTWTLAGSVIDENMVLYLEGTSGPGKTSYGAYQASGPTITFPRGYGGNGDTWGVVYRPDQINDPTFGIAIVLNLTPLFGHYDAILQYLTLTVYYQPEGGFAAISSGYADDPPASGNTYALSCTNFGFDLPEDAIVTGVELSYTGETLAGTIGNGPIALQQDGTILAQKTGAYGMYHGGFQQVFGGAADSWGVSLSRDDVNSDQFGVFLWFSVVAEGPGEYQLDLESLVVTVYYQLETGFAIPDDAVLYASRTAELRTEGMFRTYDGMVYGPMATVIGDLPRLPPSGMEGRPVELLVRPSSGDFETEGDDSFGDFTVTPYYRPCWLDRP